MVEVKTTFEELDAWVRRKPRCLLWRQWKKPRTRLKKLCQLGIDRTRASKGAMNSYGPWRNAGASHMNQALPNSTLRKMGLVGFLDEHRDLRAPLEPPDAERHVRWCGRWGRVTAPGDPIPRLFEADASSGDMG